MLRAITFIASLAGMGLISACGANAPENTAAAPELHVIGIYEGFDYENKAYAACQDACRANNDDRDTQRECLAEICVKPEWPGKTSMSVVVEVDRPGAPMTLVLGAYDPMEWNVTTMPGTVLGDVVLIGYGAKEARVTINGSAKNSVLRMNDVDAPYKPAGDRFRYVADRLPAQYGFERIASFQGGYRAPAEGFRIDGPINRPEFEPDYLKNQLSPLARNHPMRIEASIGGKTGKFTIDGRLVEDLLPISSGLAPINAERTRAYVWQRGGVRVVSVSDNTTVETLPIPEDRRRGHFKGMVLDESRNRLILMYQAGAALSEIFTLDLATGVWGPFGTTQRTSPTSAFYDEATDSFLIVSSSFSTSIEIGRLTPAGFYAALREINVSDLSGAEDLFEPGNGPAPRFSILDVKGDKIALATDGQKYHSEPKIAPLKRIYEYDLSTGEARLTYYE